MRLLAAPNSTPCNFTFSMMIRFNRRPDDLKQGLRTPNEGIHKRNLKIWADVADKICFGRT